MHTHRLCSLLLPLPGVQLPGLKASSDTAWLCILGSDCMRTAKVREGAERHLVWGLCPLAWALHLNSGFSLGGCLSYTVGLPVCGIAPCSSWLSLANPGLVPFSSLKTGLDSPGLSAYLVTVTGPALLTLLWDQPLVGEAPARPPCCHPWLTAPLALWSSPVLLFSEKHSGFLESFQHVNFCLKKTNPKPHQKNPNSKLLH